MKICENIDLKHQLFLSTRFRQMNLNISDYTFANVYLFRNICRYEILTRDCGTFISAYNRFEQNYIMPLDVPKDCSTETFRELLDQNRFFFPIPEEWLSLFPPSLFEATWDDGESDYIFLTKSMASFSGKTFTRHRNHLNQFFGAYQTTECPLGPDTIDDGLEVLKLWQQESRLPPGKTDFAVCKAALETFVDLALWGTIYYIEKKPAGFIIGEALNTDMFCLHFAKASKAYHGIYEFMFNDTAKKLEARYRYLNFEEDMGDKNLRKTKNSYGPERIIRKYRIHLKNGAS
jgi:hypothetical protein